MYRLYCTWTVQRIVSLNKEKRRSEWTNDVLTEALLIFPMHSCNSVCLRELSEAFHMLFLLVRSAKWSHRLLRSLVFVFFCFYSKSAIPAVWGRVPDSDGSISWWLYTVVVLEIPREYLTQGCQFLSQKYPQRCTDSFKVEGCCFVLVFFSVVTQLILFSGLNFADDRCIRCSACIKQFILVFKIELNALD